MGLSVIMRQAVLRCLQRLLPASCPGCRQRCAHQGLCARCAPRLAAIAYPASAAELARVCAVCAHPLAAGTCPDCHGQALAFERLVYAMRYRDLGKSLVLQYKTPSGVALAPLLARLLHETLARAHELSAHQPAWAQTILVPVPSHALALRQRGFSPPAEIARLLARATGATFGLPYLWRERDLPRQGGMSRAQRLQLSATAFKARIPAALQRPDLKWVLVDDVYTTGATMQSACLALRAAGAGRIEAWVLARAC